MATATVEVLPLYSMMELDSSLIQVIQLSTAPDMMPGSIMRAVTVKKVFMGDTGSLFLGGMVCGLAFALDMPLVLILVGIIYIIETVSVIMQVTYFKLTHGKRIFRMAPLHHHLEMGGWSEAKLVFVFTGITLVCCVLAFFGAAGRFPAM